MQKSDLTRLDPFVAQEYVLEELCYAHYKNDGSELDKRIEKVWKAMRGTKFYHRESTAFSFVAGPQQAKTFSFTDACRMFAEAVGLDFVKNPDDATIVELNESGNIKNSFVFVCYEAAGEMSASTTGGLISKTNVNGKDMMTKLPFMKFAAIEQAAAGMLLLDDLSNALPGVRNALFPLLQEKRVGALNFKGKYVASTRNRGSLDGTHTSQSSSAEVSRSSQFEIHTTPETWLEHIIPLYKGTPTEMVIESFMLNHGHEHFYRPPNKLGDPSWPGCRTWTSCLSQTHTEMLMAEELMLSGRSVDSIVRNVSDRSGGAVGIDTGSVFTAHVRTWLKGALPCALNMMKDGELKGDLKRLFNSYVVDKANTPEGADFAMSYSYALANEAANQVIKELDSGKSILKNENDIKVILNKFVNGVYNVGMHEDKISLAMGKFKDIVVESSQAKHKLGRVNEEGMTVVNDDFLMLMTEVVGTNQIARSEHPDLPGTKLYDVTFTEVFSNSAKLESDVERVIARRSSSEFSKIKESLKDLSAETPSMNAISQGMVQEKPAPIEQIAEEVATSFVEDSKDNAVDEGTLEKVMEKTEVENFKLEVEEDGVVPDKKKEVELIDENEFDMLDKMLG